MVHPRFVSMARGELLFPLMTSSGEMRSKLS